jgi:hypothetical protein
LSLFLTVVVVVVDVVHECYSVLVGIGVLATQLEWANC